MLLKSSASALSFGICPFLKIGEALSQGKRRDPQEELLSSSPCALAEGEKKSLPRRTVVRPGRHQSPTYFCCPKTKCPRRFCCQHCSLLSVQNGFSLP